MDATKFGSECVQGGPNDSEDCLFLNVYTPDFKRNHHGSSHDRDDDDRLPVMVWIHGGALVSGGGDIYDPTPLVKKGVIVVTINYRLGLLGFFAHPALDSEGHLAGNYGLMDQQLALRWVRDNIEAFGGDPHQVTIFGESAGGESVYSHLASPTAKGLFRRAIAESGAYVEFQDYWNFIVPLAQGETTGTSGVPSGISIATALGCASQTAACLRALPAATVVTQNPGTAYPFVDGTILTQTPTSAFSSGQFNQVPIISGGNHDEWRIFVAQQYDFTGHPILTLADYTNAVLALWGPTLAPPVDALYPFASFPSGGVALGASGTDGIFACPERNSVHLLSKFVPTYAYEFNDENAPPAQSTIPILTFPLGAYHFAEVQYLFVVGGTPAVFSTDQQQLSATMIDYWTQFAKNANPNSPGVPTWPRYSSTKDVFQSLVPPTPAGETNFDASHLCSGFWNTF